MEENAEVFREASIEALVDKIKKGSRSFPSLQEYAVHLVKVLDKNNDSFVSLNEFVTGL